MRFLALCLICLLMVRPVCAQETAPVYVPTSIDNLAKAYFHFGLLDSANNQHLDQYIALKECDISKKYYQDEFEWTKIRDVVRADIDTHKAAYPERYSFVQPANFDRYDLQTSTFSVRPEFQIQQTSRLQVSGNDGREVACRVDEKILPFNAIVTLDKPFNLVSVKVAPDTAKAYLEYLENKRVDIRDGRPAYIKYNITFTSAGQISSMQNPVANFYGRLDSLQVYADQAMTIPLAEITP